VNGEEGEDQIDRSHDDDVQKNGRNFVTGSGEDILGVIENDVDATPLHDERQQDAEAHDAPDARLK